MSRKIVITEQQARDIVSSPLFQVVNDLLTDGVSVNNQTIMQKYGLNKLTLTKKGNVVTINMVTVSNQNQGNGTRFMTDLVNVADKNGWILVLTPDDSFGATSMNRLKNFYKRFGFRENKGRNMDFSINASMIRPAKNAIYESIDELDLYHGTNADFEHFSEDFYLTGIGEMAYGWGVYLTNSINTAKEYSAGGQIMTVTVPDGKYLDSRRIGKAEAMKLARAFYKFYLSGKGADIYKGSEQEFWDYECSYIATVPDGSYLYGTVSTFLGSDKEASEWLHSMGYTGLRFPGHNKNTGEKFMNYVIFDTKDVKIIKKQQSDSLNESVNKVRGITKLDICNRTMRVIERRNGVELSDEGKKWFIGLMNGAKFGVTMDMILEKAAFTILNIPSFPIGQSVGNEWDELDGILRIVIQKTGVGNDILQRLRALKFGQDRKIISDGEWSALEIALQYYPDILKELKRCYGNFAVVAPVIYKAVDYLKRYKDGTAALEFCYLVGYQREHARAALRVAVDQVLHGIGSHLLPQVTSKK